MRLLFCITSSLWLLNSFTMVIALSAEPSHSPAQKLKSLFSSSSDKKQQQPKSAILLPGVFDALSAKVFSSNGAKALFLSGFGVSACKLAQPDVGVLSLTEMESALRSVVQAVSSENTPVIVDGDTGFGGAVNIRRTVRAFASAGAAAVTIEDQVFPKKCTYAAGEGVRVVSREECFTRVKAALAAQKEAKEIDGNEILIVARTDCRAALGFEEALERCLVFEELGADVVYAENLQSRQEYEVLRSKLQPSTGTILAQVQLFGNGDGEQNLYSLQDISEMKYDFALLGVTALQAYVSSLNKCASIMLDLNSSGLVDGDSSHNLNLCSFEELKSTIGFEDSESFHSKYDNC